MFDLTQLFINSAYAQAAGAPEAPAGSVGMSFVPLLLILGVFYVLLIRPQQKKLQEQEKMIKSLKRGDRVVTAGGIHGKISKLLDDGEHLMLEIADGLHVKVVRNTIVSLAAKTEPAKADTPVTEEDKKD